MNHLFDVTIWGNISDWAMVAVTSITAIFLYITLTKQIEASKEQRVKNESDIIFLLINQLEVEYANYSVTYTERTGGQPSVRRTRYGYDALCSYYGAIKNDTRPNRLQGIKDDIATDNLLSLIRSFMLVKERVDQTNLSEEIKSLFYRKLEIMYRTKFEFPIDCLLTSLNEFDDSLVTELKNFKQSNS